MGSIQQTPDYGRRLILSSLNELAQTQPDRVLFKYPLTTNVQDGFRSVTTKLMANAVNRVAYWVEESLGRCTTYDTIGYIGPNDFRYYAFVLGAVKAGYKLLLCSPRNSLEGQTSLIDATGCKNWIVTSQLPVDHILAARPMKVLQAPEIAEVFSGETVASHPYSREYDEVSAAEPMVVLHTSGSTGLPKPIVVTQGAACAYDGLKLYRPIEGCPALEEVLHESTVYSQMPPFHAAGLFGVLYSAIWSGTTVVIGPPLPPSPDIFEAMVDNAHFDGMFIAPSTVEDISKSEGLLDKISEKRFIVFGGGPVSQDGGDKVSKRLRLCNVIGTTECGWLPFLKPRREDWNWFIPHPDAGFEFRPFTDGLYQLYFVRTPKLALCQGIFQTFPDIKEYTSGDLFSKHPTKPNHWKSEGRFDDVIVLSNGEKIQPLSMEETLGTHPLIKAAMVVGQARFQSALIIEAADKAPASTPEVEKFIDEIWPTVEKANSAAPTHAAISRDHIAIVQPGTFLRAGKGTIQRFQTVKALKSLVDGVYDRAEAKSLEKAPKFDLIAEAGFRDGVRDTVKLVTGLQKLNDDQDFFAAGVDSLQVISIAKLIQAGVHKKDIIVEPRLVYSHPSITALSAAAWSLVQTGSLSVQTRDEDVGKMKAMLEKYTRKLPTARQSKLANGGRKNVVLTGSTGSLGSYLLHTLIQDSKVYRIWCVNRSSDAEERQAKGHIEKGLNANFSQSKVCFLKADLSKPNLDLSASDYEDLTKNATHIIHNQWQVDFNLSLASFEPHVAGVRNLIDFAAKASHSMSLLFTSSIGVVNKWNSPEIVPEQVIEDFSVANMGYGQSKLVSEVLLAKGAEAGALQSNICRVGQIAGPVTHGSKGIWNPKEWLPTIIEASAHLGVVPSDIGGMSDVDWIPVDLLSQSIVELTLYPAPPGSTRVFHTVNPQKSKWSSLVPEIQDRLSKKTKQKVSIATFAEWTKALRAAVEKPSGVDIVPGAKLLGFYEGMAIASNSGHGAVLDTTGTQMVSGSLSGLESVNESWMGLWLDQWGY